MVVVLSHCAEPRGFVAQEPVDGYTLKPVSPETLEVLIAHCFDRN